jgi:hypothetical protein
MRSVLFPGHMPALRDPHPQPPFFVAWERGGRFFISGQDSVPLQLPSRPEGSPILVSQLTGLCARHTWATQPYRCCHLSLTGLCALHTWATQPNRCGCLNPYTYRLRPVGLVNKPSHCIVAGHGQQPMQVGPMELNSAPGHLWVHHDCGR